MSILSKKLSCFYLKKCILAIYLVTSNKKGISSLQLSRHLDVTYKTAWFLSHKIRKLENVDVFNDVVVRLLGC